MLGIVLYVHYATTQMTNIFGHIALICHMYCKITRVAAVRGTGMIDVRVTVGAAVAAAGCMRLGVFGFWFWTRTSPTNAQAWLA